ncbi:MAG TPA: pantetheine-phosphate adenylyltransferase [Firmicutes bacterium]|nr:pantetheine-phosphate adenylyltransferase [Bacillota bacterium]
MAIAIYPGSFDPVTNGHIDIIVRAGLVFDKVIVTVMDNPRKTPAFTLEERLEMLVESTKGMKNVEVDYYHGLLIDYVKQKKAKIIVKGLRAISDFEFEFQMALINRKLNEEVETMFMMTNNKYSYLSSSIIKEIASYGGDVRKLVPSPVLKKLTAKYIQKE